MKFKILRIVLFTIFISISLIGCNKKNSTANDTSALKETESIPTTEEELVIDVDENKDSTLNENASTYLKNDTITESDESSNTTLTVSEANKAGTLFENIFKNEKYQTQVEDGDTLVDITFKDVGTITFKMYNKTAPQSVNWFLSLINNNTPIAATYTDNVSYGKMMFETTDREFYKDEITDELFPIKGCIYQKMSLCNQFYFVTSDMKLTDSDSKMYSDEVINYFNNYGGNFEVYDEAVLIGYAITNVDLISQLNNGFEVESIVVH